MGDKCLPLLPVSIEDMTRDSLRVFIPKLISDSVGQEKIKMGVSAKPIWWPEGVPWTSLRQDTLDEGGKNKLKLTEVLRNVVRSCYQYYDSEHLLQGDHGVTAPDSPIQVVNIVDGSVSFIPQKFVNGIPMSQLEATVPASSEMCAMPVPTHVFQKTSPTSVNRARGKKVHSIEIFICYFCEKDFTTKSDLHDHQAWCIMRPPQLKHLPRKRKLKLVPVDELPRADRKPFVEALGLVPLSKARVMKKHQSRNRDIEITQLDDNDTNSQTSSIKSPSTPKTPRSLMSQLSRDLSPPSLKSRKKSLMVAFNEDEEEVPPVSKQGVSGEETTATSEQKESVEKEEKDFIKKTSLLTIDLCSSLGQRVKKLMNEQAKVFMTSFMEEDKQPYEEFCHTPKKNGMLSRLRNRTLDFPVTFRKSRKTLPKFAHQFKFKNGQRKEWYMTSITGLNARSRELKKSVKKCRVDISRLSKKEIEKWALKRRPNYYVNISRLSDLQQPGRAVSSTSLKQLTLENLLTHNAAHVQKKLLAYPHVQLNMGLKSALVNGSSVSRKLYPSKTKNDVIDLTPPSTPESAKSPRPIQLLAKSPEQARMLQQLLQRPLQNRLPPYQSPVKNTALNNNNNIKKPPVARGKKRFLEEDDVICLSSDEELESRGVKPPPSKCQKMDTSRKSNPTLLFKCHLCHTELTCYGSFSNYIEGHFAEKHNVHNIQLVEHIDSRGQKVVSIVEKVLKKNPAQSAPTQSKVTSKRSQANNVAAGQDTSDNKQNPAGASRQNTASSSTTGTKTINKGENSTAKSKLSQVGNTKSSAAVKRNPTPQVTGMTGGNSVGRRRSNRSNGTAEESERYSAFS